jgi:hypothetical protein
MSQTVIAIFRDIADAQLARTLLLAEGVASDDIEIDDPARQALPDAAPGWSTPLSIGRLLKLFGADAGEPAPDEGTAGAMVKVVVDDELDASVRHALAEVGAADVHSQFADLPPVRAPRATGLSGAFKRHYQEHYAALGASYSIYEPAYRYGASLIWEAQDTGPEWEALEEQARQGWQARHRGSNWEHFRAAVRYGWSEARRCSLPLPGR